MIVTGERMNRAQRRYLGRFLIFIALWAVANVLVRSTFSGWAPDFSGASGVLWAVLPALPMGGVIWSLGAYLSQEEDEFVRMKQVRAMLIALGLTLFSCTVWGELSRHMDVAPLPLFQIFPMWCVFYAVGTAYVGWRYR